MDSAGHVDVNGLSFGYRLDGPIGAPWLMFSNSLMTNLSLWDAQIDALAGAFRILRYDQRGHGATGTPDHAADMDELVSDAACLLDRFEIARATVIGVSMGASTALCLAARAPDRVVGVVASDGQAATPPGGAAAWQERIELAMADGMEGLAEVTIRRWMTPGSIAAAGPAVHHVRDMIRATDRDGFIACARALQGYDFRAMLPEIVQPTLLIAGESDGAMPRTMQEMQRTIPHARYVEIPGAGHLPNIEAPAAFNAALLDFLAEAR